MPQVCHPVDRMGDTMVLFKCATAVDYGRHVRWVHTAIPSQRARASSVGKTPSFSFCQVDMYADRPVHSDTNSDTPGNILARQQLRAKTHISTTVYSQVLIYTAESTGSSVKRTKMPNPRNSSKGRNRTIREEHKQIILTPIQIMAFPIQFRSDQVKLIQYWNEQENPIPERNCPRLWYLIK